MHTKRSKLISSMVAAIVLGATSFPAIYTGLGIALPASQSITFDLDPERKDTASRIDAFGRNESVDENLSFRESLSIPKRRFDILRDSRSYQLSREPHAQLIELAGGFSILIALGAGLAWYSRSVRQ